MSDMKGREFITLRSDAADPALGWTSLSLSWLAVLIGCLYVLSAKLSSLPTAWPCSGRPPALPRAP
jgi:hypothetical protein